MTTFPKGPVSWMAQNSVAANLLMLFFIIGGLVFASRVKQEIFPEFELDIIQISLEYPGASPEEVEEGIILSIEDEVRSLDGVKKVTSTSFEGKGVVNVELLTGANHGKLLQDVKNSVDKILSFPEEAERPIVSLLEPRREVVSLILFGEVNKQTLRDLAEKVRDELIHLEGITLVELSAVPPLEISIEVPQKLLRAYNLRLEQIADLVRQTALDLPGGGIKASGGEVLLRTKEKRDFAREFEDIPIITTPEGSKVLLEDIAIIQEKFEETDEEAFFNGEPAVRVDVFRVGNQNPIDIAERVQKYANQLQAILPDGIKVALWNDRSEIYRDRIDLLLRNAALGLLLVLLLLGLFLEPKLAFWVTLGIPISIIGSFLFIPITGASINMISLFAFIVTLGIIVDDAILVGENVFYKREQGVPFLQAAIEGAIEITGPVTFAVLTNMLAFVPLLFVPGSTGKFFFQIPAIVISVFFVSLIESLFVLPAHLTYESKKPRKIWKILNSPNRFFEFHLKKFIHESFVPSLTFAMRNRYITVACGVALIFFVVGLFLGGHLQFSYLPRVDSDIVNAQAVLPFGVPLTKSREMQKILVKAAEKVAKENGSEKIMRGIYTQIGTPLTGIGPPDEGALQVTGSHLVGVQIFLVPSDQREISGDGFAKKWREKVGQLAEVKSLKFSGTVQTAAGPPIEIQLSHRSKEILERSAQELAQHLRNYQGISDIDDGVSLGKPQLNFKLRPEARSLNITARELAQQVRNSFYGSEALRQQRGRDEIKVMVRLPAKEREQIHTIEELILRTPTGGEIPLEQAADVIRGRAYTYIKRTDGRRVLSVTGDVDETVANANKILSDLQVNTLPNLMQKFPGLLYSFEGEQREQKETLEALGVGFLLAILGIYTVLAIPFKSYIQPIIIMLSIPFGIIGAVLGHLLLGYELSIISMFGIVALSGVVVNDSLVLVITINENYREKELPLLQSIVEGATRRFRPIMLTSLTTFFGLSPMIFETSMQARFLIPMAISLGFGVLFSTFIILFITTAIYLIIEEFRMKRNTTSQLP